MRVTISAGWTAHGVVHTFQHDHAVADAGLMLPATVARHLGLDEVADAVVGVGFRPGRRVATVVHGILAGADCIDDLDVLRAGATERVLGHKAMAPFTVGTWLRSLTFGHVRQLDKLTETMLCRAWAVGAGPGQAPMTIDVDSTVCEVHGYAKQGAAYGYTRVLGYHPILATRAARRCTPACAPGRRTPPAARSGSCARRSGGCVAPAPPGR